MDTSKSSIAFESVQAGRKSRRSWRFWKMVVEATQASLT
jgi:hypothetical protein